MAALPPGSAEHQSALDNHALLETEVERRPSPINPVELSLDEDMPWQVNVGDRSASAGDIAYELYGVDISPIMPQAESVLAGAMNFVAEAALGIDLGLSTAGKYIVIQDLLRDRYKTEFHEKMTVLLDRDIDQVESILLNTIVDKSERETLIEITTWWSRRRDCRTEQGNSYFDAYLGYLGEQAVEFYQEEYEQTGNPLYLVGGGFAGLWTPETATNTILMLTTARVAPSLLAAAPLRVQQGALLLGTGLASYGATSALLEASTGVAQDGRQLSETERATRAIYGVMDIVFLWEGFRAAGQIGRSGSRALAPAEGAAVTPASPQAGTPGAGATGGGTQGSVRILSMDADGNIIAVGRSPTGEFAYARINVRTGEGVIVHQNGTAYPISNGEILPPRLQLSGAGGAPQAAPAPPAGGPVEPANAYRVLGRSYPSRTPGRQHTDPFSGETYDVAARAGTPRSLRTAIDADLVEAADYRALLDAGEIGLAGTNGANRGGPDSITYNPQDGYIYVNDSQTYWTPTPPTTKATSIPPRWRVEADQAAWQADFGDADLESRIRDAAAQGRIRRRNHTPVQVSPPASGSGPYVDIGSDL